MFLASHPILYHLPTPAYPITVSLTVTLTFIAIKVAVRGVFLYLKKAKKFTDWPPGPKTTYQAEVPSPSTLVQEEFPPLRAYWISWVSKKCVIGIPNSSFTILLCKCFRKGFSFLPILTFIYKICSCFSRTVYHLTNLTISIKPIRVGFGCESFEIAMLI